MSISAFHVREQFSRSHINNSTDVVDHVTVLLLELEAQRRRFNSPVLFFMFILAVVGVLGNVCVLFVYRVRFTKTSGNFFIMTLAVLDLLSSCLCVPFDLYDLSFPYTQSSSIACRLFRFMECATTVAAGLILTCVAFSRYFKIVNPFRMYSVGQARSLVILMFAITASICWPELVMKGTRKVPTPAPEIWGRECDHTDSFCSTIYPHLYYTALLAVFILCFSIMLVFYGCIIWVVWIRGHTQLGERVANHSVRRHGRKTSTNNKNTSSILKSVRRQSHLRPDISTISENCCLGIRKNITFDQLLFSPWPLSDDSMSSSQQTTSTLCRMNSSPSIYNLHRLRLQLHQGKKQTLRHHPVRKRRSTPQCYFGRTTRILSLVTLVAFISYIPYLTVQVAWTCNDDVRGERHESWNYIEELGFLLCRKSHYLSIAANPVIYSLLHPAFRRQTMIAFKTVFGRSVLSIPRK